MKKNGLFKSMALLVLGFSLASCTKDLPPGEYDANEIGKIKKVIPGTVISMRTVNLRKQAPELTQDGTPTRSDNLIEGGYNQTRGVEYVIKLNSGGIISVVQAEDLKLKNKQKILVIYGRNTRVVADHGSDSY